MNFREKYEFAFYREMEWRVVFPSRITLTLTLTLTLSLSLACGLETSEASDGTSPPRRTSTICFWWYGLGGYGF